MATESKFKIAKWSGIEWKIKATLRDPSEDGQYPYLRMYSVHTLNASVPVFWVQNVITGENWV